LSEIIKLPQDISNKIAAGEVVERPFNVVKELLENSIDAGADRIDVEINEDGFSLIKVTDNGKGILPEDLPKTIERYATSKIKRFEDIYSINSYGFRGEALAAISSVSDFKIHSIRPGNDGFVLIKNFGETPEIKPSPIPKGTIVEVANLFQKIPVRKKFLKNSSTEFKEILKFIKAFAAINYHISLLLKKDGIIIFEVLRDKNMLDRIQKLYNESSIFLVTNSYSSLALEGVISTPDNQKYRKDFIIIAINKRIIKDYNITQSIINAYSRLIPENRFPLAFINLTIPVEDVDVNIHPTKMTVKFFNSNDIFPFVYDSIKNALNNLRLTDNISSEHYEKKDIKESQIDIGTVKENDLFYDIDLSKLLVSEKLELKEEYNENEDNQEIKIIGQIFKTILLCEKGDDLIFIDQHIAHERVLYEKYRESNHALPSIVLHEPILMEISNDEYDTFKNNNDLLKKYGFDIELFGNHHLKISSIPSSFIKKDPIEELKNLFAELTSSQIPINDKIPLIMSCKNAIKAGDYLTKFEMEELVKNLFNTSNPYTCPHGRPIIFKMNKSTLFKKFQR